MPALLAGVALGRWLPPVAFAGAGALDRAGFAGLACGGAALLCAMTSFFFRSASRPAAKCAVVAALAFAAGIARAWPCRPDAVAPDLPVALVEGVVRTPPRRPLVRSGDERRDDQTPETWFDVRLPDGGNARVVVPLPPGAAPPDLLPGDGVRVLGRVRPRRPPSTPGAPEPWDPAPAPPSVDVDAAGASAVDRIPHLMGAADRVRRAGERLRRAALDRLRGACPDDRLYGLLACVLTGDRSELPPDIRRAFRDSGTSHLLAVSGLHVVFLLGAASLLGRVVLRTTLSSAGADRVTDAVGLPLAVAAVGLYCAVCRFETPVVRASVFVAVRALATTARRRSHPLDQLALAAGVVAAADPGQVYDVGFLLSFVAVLGLVLLVGRFREALFPDVDILLRFPEALSRRRRAWLRWFPAAVSQTAAAQFATAPVIAAAFGVVQPAGAVANLVGVPAFAVVVPLSAVLAIAGAACVPVTEAVARAVCVPVVAVLDAVASAPGASVGWGRPPPWAVMTSVALLVAAAARRRWSRRDLALPAASLLLLAVPARLARPAADEAVVLDTGHGLCVVVRSAAGGVVLYDAGGRASGIGERVLVPALLEIGVRRIDALLLSHEDSDHTGGFSAIADAVEIGRVVVGAGFGASPLAENVIGRCSDERIPILAVGAGDEIRVPGMRVRVLHPPTDNRGGCENDDSIVALVTIAPREGDDSGPGREGFSLLLTGDLEGPALESLAAAPPFADVLVLPHHGRAPPAPVERLSAAAGFRIASSADPETGLPAAAWSTSVRGTVTLRPGSPPAPWFPPAEPAGLSPASPPPTDRRRTER